MVNSCRKTGNHWCSDKIMIEMNGGDFEVERTILQKHTVIANWCFREKTITKLKIIKAVVAYGFDSILYGVSAFMVSAFEFTTIRIQHTITVALILITIAGIMNHTHGTMIRHKVGTINVRIQWKMNSVFNQCSFHFNANKCSESDNELSTENNAKGVLWPRRNV